MAEEPSFTELLKQRIQMHAEADYARATSAVVTSTATQLKKNKPSACHKWLESFKQRHGMTYGIYRGLVKRGMLPRIGKVPCAAQEPAEKAEPPQEVAPENTATPAG